MSNLDFSGWQKKLKKRFEFSVIFYKNSQKIENESFAKICHNFSLDKLERIFEKYVQLTIKRPEGYVPPDFDTVELNLYTMTGEWLENWKLKEAKQDSFMLIEEDLEGRTGTYQIGFFYNQIEYKCKK